VKFLKNTNYRLFLHQIRSQTFKKSKMTPKEKAKELFNAFLLKVGTNCEHDSYCDNEKCNYNNKTICCVDLSTSKQCAYIAINLILLEHFYDDSEYGTRRYNYFLEVKQEIKKI